MKAFSAVKPDQVWVRKIEGGKAIIRVRENIKSSLVKDEQGERTEWECDETEVSYPLSAESLSFDDVKALVVAKMADIKSLAEKEEAWADICNQLRELWGI